MMPKFILILGDSFRHRLFCYLIQSSGLHPDGIVVISSKSFISRCRNAPTSTFFSSIQSMFEFLKMPFLALKTRNRFKEVQHIVVSDVNHHSVFNLINSAQPDLVFVYGSNVIKKRLLSIETLWLNAHGGVLPGYRGLDSNVWAISDGRFDCVGFTIHKVSSQLDAGEIFIKEVIPVYSLLGLLFIRLDIAIKLSNLVKTLLRERSALDSIRFSPNHVGFSIYRSHITLFPLTLSVFNILRKGLNNC